jgi:hypothetical protein
MLLETLGERFASIRSISSTDTGGFPSRVPTVTKPTVNDGVLRLRGGGMMVQNGILLLFYGIQSNDNTGILARVLGWRSVGQPDTPSELWIPVPLAEFTMTIGNIPGIVNSQLAANQLFADTLAINNSTGTQGTNVDVVSPANDTIAHALVDLKGFQMVEVIFNVVQGTDMNALYALF